MAVLGGSVLKDGVQCCGMGIQGWKIAYRVRGYAVID